MTRFLHYFRFLPITALMIPAGLNAGTISFVSDLCAGHGAACQLIDTHPGTTPSNQEFLDVAVGSGHFSGATMAVGSPGTLGVSSSISVTNYHPETVNNVTSMGRAFTSSNWNDQITISGVPSSFNISYTFSLHGSFATTTSLIQSDFGLNGLLCTPDFSTCFQNSGDLSIFTDGSSNVPSVPSTFTETFTGLTGNTFAQSFGMNAETTLQGFSAQQQALFPNFVFTGSGSAQFANTVVLTSLLFTDAQGNPIPGVAVADDTGFDLPLDPANAASAAPEPAPAAFIAGGLACLLLLQRRRTVTTRSRCSFGTIVD